MNVATHIAGLLALLSGPLLIPALMFSRWGESMNRAYLRPPLPLYRVAAGLTLPLLIWGGALD